MKSYDDWIAILDGDALCELTYRVMELSGMLLNQYPDLSELEADELAKREVMNEGNRS